MFQILLFCQNPLKKTTKKILEVFSWLLQNAQKLEKPFLGAEKASRNGLGDIISRSKFYQGLKNILKCRPMLLRTFSIILKNAKNCETPSQCEAVFLKNLDTPKLVMCIYVGPSLAII